MSWSQLQHLASSGQLAPNDLVWKAGMSAWAAASAVNGLFLPPPVPPVPAMPTMPPPPSASSPPPVAQPPTEQKSSLLALIRQASDLWRRLTRLQRIIVILVAVLVVVLFFVSTLIKTGTGGEQGKSLWQTLMDLGVVSGAVGLVYGLLQKVLERNLFSDGTTANGRDGGIDEPGLIRSSRKIQVEPVFMGLSSLQWLVTLYAVFLPGLAGTIVMGFLFGARSLWINGTALCVMGLVIAVLSMRVTSAFRQQMQKEESHQQTAESAAVAFVLKLSLLLGVSACIPALVALIGALVGIGPYTTWVYFLYGAAIFLPWMHVLITLAQMMLPFRRSAGLWISGSYLCAMFVSCAVISMTVLKPSPLDRMLGKWEEVEDRSSGEGLFPGMPGISRKLGISLEFTRDGLAVLRTPFGGPKPTPYHFTKPNELEFDASERSQSIKATVTIVSDNEILLTLEDKKHGLPPITLRRSTGKSQPAKGSAGDVPWDRANGSLAPSMDSPLEPGRNGKRPLRVPKR